MSRKLITKYPADLSGFIVGPDESLDLRGKLVRTTKPIQCFGEVVGGTYDYSGPDDTAAIHIPKQATGAHVAHITVKGGGHNGAVRVWGKDALVERILAHPGTGWGLIGMGCDRLTVLGFHTKNLQRGGIYIGSETDGDWVEDITIDGFDLDCADYEAVLRLNTAVNAEVKNGRLNNTRSKSAKEACQIRGGSVVLSMVAILGSTSNGQQENGTPRPAVVSYDDCLIYGYNQCKPGSNVTFNRGSVTIAKTLTLPNGKTYTLANEGGGIAFGLAKADRGLAKAVCTVNGTKVVAPTFTGGIAARAINVEFNGKKK